LEEKTDEGVVQFYADAEAVLARVPRRGIPMILKAKRDGTAAPYGPKETAKLVRRIREKFALPDTFTFGACRHGGMTELEGSRADGPARDTGRRRPMPAMPSRPWLGRCLLLAGGMPIC
jgi:hypothetical protein